MSGLVDSRGIVLARSPKLLEAEVEVLVATLRDRRPSYDAPVALRADTLQHLLQAYFGHDLVLHVMETGEIDDQFVAEQPIRVQNVIAGLRELVSLPLLKPHPTPSTAKE